jgi:hypothetical protein
MKNMSKSVKIAIIALGSAVVILGAAVIYGYGDIVAKAAKISELEGRLELLKGDSEGKEVLQKKIQFYEKENEMEASVIKFSYDLTKAYMKSNLDKVDPLLADDVVVIKDHKKIYIVTDGDLKNKSLLFDTTLGLVLREMVLSDYEKVDDTTYLIEMKQYFEDAKGEAYPKTGMLSLSVTDDNGTLKVKDARFAFK